MGRKTEESAIFAHGTGGKKAKAETGPRRMRKVRRGVYKAKRNNAKKIKRNGAM